MISGKFIGKTSCGFETGKIYDIDIRTNAPYIFVQDCRSFRYCPYDSMISLLQNWEIPPKVEKRNSWVKVNIDDEDSYPPQGLRVLLYFCGGVSLGYIQPYNEWDHHILVSEGQITGVYHKCDDVYWMKLPKVPI